MSIELNLPAFYLGDYDPYGLDILLAYTIGNPQTCHEYHTLPSLLYLGIFLEDA